VAGQPSSNISTSTSATLATPVLGQVTSETRRFTDNIVRVGFNYRWGGGSGYGSGY
jgi:hypothetical protein